MRIKRITGILLALLLTALLPIQGLQAAAAQVAMPQVVTPQAVTSTGTNAAALAGSAMVSSAADAARVPAPAADSTSRLGDNAQTSVVYLPGNLYDYGSTSGRKWDTTDTEGLNRNFTLQFGGTGTSGLNSGNDRTPAWWGLAKPSLNGDWYNIISYNNPRNSLFSLTESTCKKVYANVRFPFVYADGTYTYDSAKNGVLFSEKDSTVYLQQRPNGGYWPFGEDQFYFGNNLNVQFNMPRGGYLDSGAMTFEFAGDDDMWVYLDDTLALDIGGVHGARSGMIDFAAQRVWYDLRPLNGGEALAYDRTGVTGSKKAANGSAVKYHYYTTFQSLNLKLEDYSAHTMHIYYLERGAGDSNNYMRFNLPTFMGNPNLTKVVNGVNTWFVDATDSFTFLVQTAARKNGALTAYIGDYRLTHSDGSVTAGTLTRQNGGLLALKVGDTASFDMPAGKYVRMVETDAGAYCKTGYTVSTINTGERLAGSAESKPAAQLAGDVALTQRVGEQPMLYCFSNSTDTGALQIEKALAEGFLSEQSYTFRVMMTNAAFHKNAAVYTGKVMLTHQGVTVETETAADGSFALCAGDSALISGLPVGTEYTVTEQPDASSKLYAVSNAAEEDVDLDTGSVLGKIQSGDTVRHTFTNGAKESCRITAEKTWLDGGDAAETRPDTQDFTLTLHRSVAGGNDEILQLSPKLTVSGNVWQYDYGYLPLSDAQGRPYTYFVSEEMSTETAALYRVDTQHTGADGLHLFNVLYGTLNLTITKQWMDDGGEVRPGEVTIGVRNSEDGISAGEYVFTPADAAADDSSRWQHTFQDLPAYDAAGQAICYEPYEVVNNAVPYTVSIEGTTVTNTLKEQHTVTVRYLEQGSGRQLLGDVNAGSFYEGAPYDVTTLADVALPGYYKCGLAQSSPGLTGTMENQNVLVIIEYSRTRLVPIDINYCVVTKNADDSIDFTAAVPMDGISVPRAWYAPNESYDANRDPGLTAGYTFVQSVRTETNAAAQVLSDGEAAGVVPEECEGLVFTHYFVRKSVPVSRVQYTYYHLHYPLSGAAISTQEKQFNEELQLNGVIPLEPLARPVLENRQYELQSITVTAEKLPQTADERAALIRAKIEKQVLAATTQQQSEAEEAEKEAALAEKQAEEARAQYDALQQELQEAEKALREAQTLSVITGDTPKAEPDSDEDILRQGDTDETSSDMAGQTGEQSTQDSESAAPPVTTGGESDTAGTAPTAGIEQAAFNEGTFTTGVVPLALAGERLQQDDTDEIPSDTAGQTVAQNAPDSENTVPPVTTGRESDAGAAPAAGAEQANSNDESSSKGVGLPAPAVTAEEKAALVSAAQQRLDAAQVAFNTQGPDKKAAMEAALNDMVAAQQKAEAAKQALKKARAAAMENYVPGSEARIKIEQECTEQLSALVPVVVYTGTAAGSFTADMQHVYTIHFQYLRTTQETPVPTPPDPTPDPVPTPVPQPIQRKGSYTVQDAPQGDLPKTSASHSAIPGAVGLLMMACGALLRRKHR